jgi:hypothetical protein
MYTVQGVHRSRERFSTVNPHESARSYNELKRNQGEEFLTVA